MSFEFACSCGRRLRVPDRLAGKQARCASCRTLVQLPELPDGGSSSDEDQSLRKDTSHKSKFEVTGEGPMHPESPQARRPVTKSPPQSTYAAEEPPSRPRKKRRRQELADPEASLGMSEFYKSNTSGELLERLEYEREKKKRTLGQVKWIKDRTIFGIHISGNAIVGA